MLFVAGNCVCRALVDGWSKTAWPSPMSVGVTVPNETGSGVEQSLTTPALANANFVSWDSFTASTPTNVQPASAGHPEPGMYAETSQKRILSSRSERDDGRITRSRTSSTQATAHTQPVGPASVLSFAQHAAASARRRRK